MTSDPTAGGTTAGADSGEPVLRLEFTVEPFVEGAPGPHVTAAVDVARGAGLEVAFGPFGTEIAGPRTEVLDVVDEIVRRAMDAGATRVSVQVSST
ncbi:MAG: thiamine-binding protein [Actinomycetota bacterium]|nr:thiamine-binding protein [Actinomycetota bacterium]